MKKLTSIVITAAVILSLAGCGQQNTSSEISDSSSVVTTNEATSQTVETTSASTTVTTTTAATTTTEAVTTTAPVEEEDPAIADPTSITGEVTLNAEVSYSRGELYGAYGDIAIVGELSDSGYLGDYHLADLNGNRLNDTDYFRIGRGFDEAGTAVVYSDWQTPFIIDKQGNVLHENAVALSDGVLITREVTGQSESYGEMVNNYKYIYTDTETGAELFSIDEMAMEFPATYDVMAMTNGYSVIARSTQSAVGLSGVYIVDRQGNMTELYDTYYGERPEIYGEGARTVNYDKNNYLFLGLSSADDMLYDMQNGTYITLPLTISNWSLNYTNRDKGLFAVSDNSTAIIFEMDGDVILDGLTEAVTSGSDRYLLISDGEKWGYYAIESNEAIWFDDATNFHNGYAFVIQNGKGHFVNEDLEAVTDDIVATGAAHYDGLLYLADTDKLYTVNYPTAE